jgi:O-antigen ligase
MAPLSTSRTWDDRRSGQEWWRREAADHGRAGAQTAVTDERSDGSPAAFGALMAFTAILLLAPQTIIPVAESFRPALLAAGVGVTALLAHRFARRQALTTPSREMWIAAILAAWAVATLPLSRWPGGSFEFVFGIYLKSLIVFWLLANTLDTTGRLRRLVWALSAMAVPLAMGAIWNFLSGDYLPGAPNEKRISGYDAPLTQNPNDLALMLNLLLPLGLGLLLTRPKPMLRGLLAIGLALDVVAIILTFSRAGFLTLGVTAFVYLWKLRRGRERGWMFLAFALALLCLPLLPAGYTARLATITNADSDPTGSSQERREAMLAAISWVVRNPVIGAGVGQNMLALNAERGAKWRVVHNVYLQYAVELGLPGLVLFLMLLGACLRAMGRLEESARGDPARRELFHLAGALRASLIAFSFAALFHPVAYHFYFYYVAGMAVALKTIGERSNRRLTEPAGFSPRGRLC